MLLGLQDVTFEFGSRTIIENANWHIQPNERIGLIGYNGTGKSTILKIFTGMYAVRTGQVMKNKSVKLGFLNQDLLSFESEDTILNVVLQAFANIDAINKELADLEKALETETDEKKQEELALVYSEKLAELGELDGYDVAYKAKTILNGLGFSEDEYEKPYSQFSGGWRMRVMLAKIILENPDVLLLDEPTNHLDLPSIQWIEKYLQDFNGSIVIVSHDKYFLNRMVTKVVEVYQRKLHIYNGNYDFYETEKVQRQELQRRAFENQQDYIRQQEAFIDRFKAKASKAAQAQSAMKRIEKLDKIEDVMVEKPEMNIAFDVNCTPGKMICEFEKVSKSYPKKPIVTDASLHILRGDKIALLGANGIGKSTLLRLIANIEQFEGNIKIGHNVKFSFYAQHQLESLNMQHSILEEVRYAAPISITEQMIRNMLGCFLFSGDDVDKKIKVLSGGEKARVSLCKVILTQSNFLLLDEPTNHLDLLSIELLINALKKYEGTLICVSHDRHFVSNLANKIWYLENQILKEYVGTYEEWKEFMAQKEKNKLPPSPAVKTTPTKPAAPVEPTHQSNQEKKKWETQLQQIEKKIEECKKQIALNEEKMSQPEVLKNATLLKTENDFYLKNSSRLAELEKEYEDVFAKIIN